MVFEYDRDALRIEDRLRFCSTLKKPGDARERRLRYSCEGGQDVTLDFDIGDDAPNFVVGLWDQVGDEDLFGRALEHTVTAFADQLAAAADLVLGQGSEGRGAVLIRGMDFPAFEQSAQELHRPAEKDLYA